MAEALGNLTEESLRAEFIGWLREHLPPAWIKGIEDGDRELLQQGRRELNHQRFLEEIGAAGWAQPTWPVEYSGKGLEPAPARVIEEIKAQYQVPRSFNVIGLGMGAPTIMQWGSEEVKKRFLPPMAQNKEIWCQLFSEPGSGSDVAGLATRAVRDGDEWVVNGQKVWTTLAHVSRWGMLVARTDPDAPKHKGLTYFVVDMRAPGVEVRPLRQMTGDAEFNEVYFTEVRIPDEERLGEVGDGWRVSLTTLMNERVSIGGSIAPRGSGPIGSAVDIWNGRRDKTSPQALALKDRLVSAWIEAEVLRLTNIRAAQNRQKGVPGPEGSTGKLHFAELNKKIYELCIDLMGMDGSLYGSYEMERTATAMASRSVQQAFLRARANSIEGGTSEVMRNILGERVLGLPGDVRVDKDLPWSQVPR